MGAKSRMRKVESERFSINSYEAPTLRKRDQPEREEILLFAVEGDDGEVKEYYVPREVSRAFSMQAIEIEATRGETAAIYWAVVELIGIEGWNVLKDPQLVDDETGDRILAAIGGIVFGSGKA